MLSIRNMRVAIGITQLELAKSLGVSQAAVAQWEAELTKPRRDLLVRLAEIFGCTVDDLLRDGDERRKTMSNEWIRDALKNAGITQKELAKRCGMPPTTLSHKLSLRREFLYSEVVLICRELGIENPLPLFETKKAP